MSYLFVVIAIFFGANALRVIVNPTSHHRDVIEKRIAGKAGILPESPLTYIVVEVITCCIFSYLAYKFW